LGESLNVAILFHFPPNEYETDGLYFVYGNAHRPKSIYPNFNNSLFNAFIKTIKSKIAESSGLFQEVSLKGGLKEFIHKNILSEDASALQFSEPYVVTNAFITRNDAVKSFSELLLPGIITAKPITERISEGIILKKYKSYIFERNKDLERKVEKNKQIKDNDVELKFDIAWQNGSLNLVKALSFDLHDNQSIQQKAVTYFGYLNLLDETAKKNNFRFDFIVAEPQVRSLYKNYDRAIEILEQSNAPKRIITPSDFKKYSDETISALESY